MEVDRSLIDNYWKNCEDQRRDG